MVTLVKVKTHSKDCLNDKVNTLAKNATYSASRLVIHYTHLSDLRLLLICDKLDIKASNRKCVK